MLPVVMGKILASPSSSRGKTRLAKHRQENSNEYTYGAAIDGGIIRKGIYEP